MMNRAGVFVSLGTNGLKARARKAFSVLSRPVYAAAFAIASLALFLLYSTTANFFVLGTLEPNPLGIEPMTAILVGALAIGGGLLASVWLYTRNLGAKTCAAGLVGAAGGGSVGFLSSACVYCPPLLAYFFGAQSLYFLSAYGPVLALASVALVYYGLYHSLEAIA